MNMNQDYDVAIIGAGLSGLSAAYHLKRTCPELKFIILEARPRVGGRTFAVEMNTFGGNKSKFDIGGQWVGPLQTDLLELLKELGMSDLLYPQYLTGNKVCWIEPEHIVRYKTELPFYNPMIYLEAYTFLKKIDNIADQLDINNPFSANPALADYLDSMTVESFIRQNIFGSKLRELVRIGIRTSFGLETSQISALYAVLYGKSSGRMENLFSATNDGAQKMRIKGGAYQLSERLTDFIGTENIILNSPVTEICQDENFVTINTGRTTLTARKGIVAIPLPNLMGIKFTPPLPASRVELLRAMPMANLFKFVITFKNAFWREKKLSGETVCYGGDPADDDDGLERPPVGPVSVTYDATLPDGTAALVGFSAGHQTVYWSDCSPEKRKNSILKVIAKMLGEEALTPIDYKEKNWALEEWSGGCPVACMQPGVGRFFAANLRLPIGNLHIAGTESAQRSIGYMSGAVQAGRRAAVEVIYSLLGKYSPGDSAIFTTTCHHQSRSPVAVISNTACNYWNYKPFCAIFGSIALGLVLFSKHFIKK